MKHVGIHKSYNQETLGYVRADLGLDIDYVNAN